MRGSEAAALVDTDINDDGAHFHLGDHLLTDDDGRAPRLGVHGADGYVGSNQFLLQKLGDNSGGVKLLSDFILQALELVNIVVENTHLRAQSQTGAGRIFGDDAGAEDDHLGAGHAGDATQQYALAVPGRRHEFGGGKYGADTGHLAHDAHDGESVRFVLDVFHGQRDDALLPQPMDVLATDDGQLQGRDENLVGVHQVDLIECRRRHFDDDIGLVDLLGTVGDISARL